MDELKQASARGVAWNLVQNLISRLLGLVVVAILGRILDRSAFGAVALALAITTFGELLVNQGYGEFITQRPDLTDEHLDTAFWFNGFVGLVLTAAIALGAEPLSVEFADASVTPIVRWVSLSLVLRSFAIVPTGLLVRNLRFRSLSLRSVVASAIGGASGIAAALSGMGVYSLVLQILVGDLAATIILWGATEWRPGARFSMDCLKELAGFGAPLFGATILMFVARRLDTVIVVSALGLTVLGVYSMAQRVFQIANQVLNKSSDGVAFSALARLADSEERRRQALYRVLELTAVICFPAYLGLAIVAEPLTAGLFGSRWLDSAPVLTAFALAGLPVSLSYVHGAAIKSAARTRYLLVVNIVLVVVYLPVMLLVVDRGPAAAAYAYLAGSCVVVPFEVYFMRLALGVELGMYLKSIVGPLLATAVMGAATFAAASVTTSWWPIPRLAAEAAVGLGAYLLALGALAPATFRRCRDLVTSAIRRRADRVG